MIGIPECPVAQRYEKALPRCRSMGTRSHQTSGCVPDRPRTPRHRGKAAGTREGISEMPDRPFDGHPCRSWRASPVPFVRHGARIFHGHPLDLVGVFVNRIGRVRTMIRHATASGAVLAAAVCMHLPPAFARLVSPTGLPLPATPHLPGTVVTTVHLATVASTANKNLLTTTTAKK